ncbi:MAG: YajQ family cyclic di-GMP-binding protein [Phycisphaerales bacterium]|nr:YajQ family cyclic di-GMP-binding protein [Phycisphaerales bacterium]
MPTLDIVSRVDMQEVDNAVNNTKKSLAQRFDFRAAKYELNLDKKEKKISIQAEDNMKMEAIRDGLRTAAVKRSINLKVFDFKEQLPGPAGALKQEVKIREGLEMEIAKDIVKRVKATGLKVQASIQGDEVRLTGKQIDDLRTVMAHLNASELEVPLQYVNMKS